MNQHKSHLENLNNLLIHHCEERINLELNDLGELNQISGSSDELTYARKEVEGRIKLLWVTYQELPSIDTKAKINFLSANSKLVDILEIKL